MISMSRCLRGQQNVGIIKTLILTINSAQTRKVLENVRGLYITKTTLKIEKVVFAIFSYTYQLVVRYEKNLLQKGDNVEKLLVCIAKYC